MSLTLLHSLEAKFETTKGTQLPMLLFTSDISIVTESQGKGGKGMVSVSTIFKANCANKLYCSAKD